MGDTLFGAVVGIVVFVVVMVLYAGLSAMRDRAMNAAAVARRRERQEQLGPIAKAPTATAEELAQMKKDRQDFFSLNPGPYWGTAEYNNAEEQALLESIRSFAAVDGASLKEGLQRYYSARLGTMNGTPVGGAIAVGRIGSDIVYVPSYSGTVSADEVAREDNPDTAKHLRKHGWASWKDTLDAERQASQRLKRSGGTPNQKEYRP